MSRRWLLSLLCLSVLFLSLVQLTRARGELRVNENGTKILFAKEAAEVVLAIENSSGESLNATVEVELLDPANQSRSKATQVHAIATGNKTLNLPLTISFSNLDEQERVKLLWYRLHYLLRDAGSNNTITEGIISLSEITTDLFEIRVTTSDVAREGGRYRARVQASHPTTQRPAANVHVDAELTLEDDEDRTIKLRASNTTDSKGSASLEFVLPSRFPQYPHTSQPAGGEIHVTARRGGIVSEASGEVLVDQFAKILISTDKPLYQPGQVMHIRALLFTPAKRALANQKTLLRVSDPEGINVYRTVVESSRFGIATADWPIPENTRLGNYRIFVGVDGEDDSSQMSYDVKISRYDLPNFSVSVETDQKFYLPGQNAEVRVRADYLFGQAVTQGHVRVVRETHREWNYREQKWEIEEADKYEGKTDAEGIFVARIDLASDHERYADDDYWRFKDVTYAAYFTDPTSNRTEQRRFALRVTKQAIHVYVMDRGYDSQHHPALPLEFHVSTFYADGSPARCEVRARLSNADGEDEISKALPAFRTNRYGLAKVSGVRWPREFKGEDEVELIVSAVDSQRRKGSRKETLNLDDEQTVRVATDKTLYRTGEPITAYINSSIPDQTVTVDLLRDASVLRSERVKIRDGRGSITFAYSPDFQDLVSVAAYGGVPKTVNMVGTHTVLYPHDSELKVDLRTSQKSYRPGEDAAVDLKVRAAEGRSAESALGIVVLDKAVDERFRTEQDFGQRTWSSSGYLESLLGLDEQIAGVTLRDLKRLDLSKPVPPELELLADLLLNLNRYYSPRIYGGDQYELDQSAVFAEPIKEQLKPLTEALANHYLQKEEYPKDDSDVRRFLLESQIDFDAVRDPWNRPFRAVFSIDQKSHVLNLVSSGADERFDTADDFPVNRLEWPYFRPLGQTIDRAVGRFHQRTGNFVRDFLTLRDELMRDSVALDHLRDRWGRPYRFEFEVQESNYVIRVSSGGPDKEFSLDKRYPEDDFNIWTSTIDYFAEQRAGIDAALKHHFENTKQFPQTDEQLRAALPDLGNLLETHRDPWGRSYYRLFKSQPLYGAVQVEGRATFGESTAVQRTEIVPANKTVAFVSLRSAGEDGVAGTVDDFAVASFSSVLSEKKQGHSEPLGVTAGAVVSQTNGVVFGVVNDPNGARISGATVILKGTLDDRSYRTSSTDEGKYSFAGLQPGLYEVRFESPGFVALVVTSVWVRPANLTEVDATLQVGSVTETVMITAESGSFSSQTSASVSQTSVSVTSRRLITLIAKASSQESSTPRLREYFPETLVWQPSIETDKQGRAKLNFKLADNITTWKVAVVASTEDGRIGTTEKEIKAFQPFFIEHEPPRVLTEGDEISLPIVIRNYLEQSQNVDVEIKPESWFSLLGQSRKRIAVPAGDAVRETFDFRAMSSIKDGKQRINAIGTDDNDAIEKPVTVHPDGEEVSDTVGDTAGSSASLELNLPENMIPNSSQSELRIYPNFMAHVIESVEAIMSRPYGCAEQTISSTYPSLILLRHFKRNGEDFVLRARAEKYLKLGYSRLLNYRDENGGFSYWGHDDPDLALTAYALRFLTEAADVIAVDEEVIKGARAWLIKQQERDGSWWPHKNHAPNEDNRRSAMLTAYVLRILSLTETKLRRDESKAEPSAGVALSKKLALEYLRQRTKEINEPYLLASYALAEIDTQNSKRATPIINKLRSLAQAEGGTTYWSSETSTPFYGWGLAGRIETTALVLQALNRHCQSDSANCEAESKLISRALLFLIKQKDHYGVWHSGQATINVIDAMLTTFSASPGNSPGESATEILVNGQLVNTIQMPAGNRLVSPITFDMSRLLHLGKNTVEIRRPSGLPLASVQARINYYVPWPAENVTNHVQKSSNEGSGLRLVAKFDKTDARINDTITCYVEANRFGSSAYGMMLAEIGLPPGADVDSKFTRNGNEGFGRGDKPI